MTHHGVYCPRCGNHIMFEWTGCLPVLYVVCGYCMGRFNIGEAEEYRRLRLKGKIDRFEDFFKVVPYIDDFTVSTKSQKEVNE